jgi:hypothetical protein
MGESNSQPNSEMYGFSSWPLGMLLMATIHLGGKLRSTTDK